jgi:hypothetical protein
LKRQRVRDLVRAARHVLRLASANLRMIRGPACRPIKYKTLPRRLVRRSKAPVVPGVAQRSRVSGALPTA